MRHSIKTLKLLLVTALFTGSCILNLDAANYVWGGGNLNWNDTSASGWNGGPPASGDSAAINSGQVVNNVQNAGAGVNLTLGNTGKFVCGAQYYYGTGSLTFTSGGTLVIQNTVPYYTFGSGWLPTTVTVNGSSSTGSFISDGGMGPNWLNMNPTTTFSVADVTGNANADLTISAILADMVSGTSWAPASIIKTGAGTLALSGLNSYTGYTLINAGEIALQSTTATLGSGISAVTIASGARLVLNSYGLGVSSLSVGSVSGSGDLNLNGATLTVGLDNTSTTFAGDIGDPIGGTIGSLVKVGLGTLALTGANHYYGTTTVSGGVLDLIGNINVGWNYAGTIVTVNNGGTLRLHDWENGSNGGFSPGGNLSTNAGNLVINGGTIEMATSYTDPGRSFTIGPNGATLAVDSGVIWGLANDRSWQYYGGAIPPIPNNSNLTLTGAGTGQLDLALSGPGSLTKNGSGTWTLTGSNVYTGPTTVSGGVLDLTGYIYNLGGNANSVVTVNNGGTLRLHDWENGWNGGFTHDGNFSTQSSNLVIDGGTIEMATSYTDPGRSFTIGPNGATLAVDSGVIWGLANDRSWQYYGGAIPLIPNNSSLTLSGSGTGQLDLAVSGTGSLTKNGSGTWTLTGSNVYTGPTTVSGGVLDLTGHIYCWGGNANSIVTVNNGGTLRLHDWENGSNGGFSPGGNFGTQASNLVIDGGTIEMASSYTDPGRSFTIGPNGATLAVDSGVIWALTNDRSWQYYGGAIPLIPNNSNLTLTGAGTGQLDLAVSGTGSLTKNGSGTWTLTGSNFFTGTTTVNSGTLALANGRYAAISVASGATLYATGVVSLSQMPVMAAGSTLNFGLNYTGSSGRINLTGAYAAPSSPITVNIPCPVDFTLWPTFSNYNFGMCGGIYNLITGAAGISSGSYVLGSTPAGYTCTLSASNGTLSVTVTPTTAPIGLPGAASATDGGAFNYQIALVNNPTGYAATGLPAGLSLNTSTGLITGTVLTPGIYYVTVSATYPGGVATSPLLVAAPPATPFVLTSNNPAVVLSSSGASMTVQPVLDNTLLINPGKGFASYKVSPSYGPNIYAVGHNGFCWADLETAEGVYDWSKIDNSIAAFARAGMKVCFGVANYSTGTYTPTGTPQWVYNLGVASAQVPDSSCPTGYTLDPASWEDPIFLAKMKAFIAAFGARYNGHPNIEHMYIYDYGDWGELGANPSPDVTPAQLEADFYQPYFDAFPNTQLVINSNSSTFWGNASAWATAKGAGAIRCSMCAVWSLQGAEDLVAYPHGPGVLEYGWDWATMVANGNDPNSGLAWTSPGEYLMYVTGARASYAALFPEFYYANPAFCQMAGNILGYHFVIQQATIPTSVQANVPFPMSLTWLNNGVAPLYNPCSVAVAVLDANNNVVQKQWLSNSNPKGWMPGITTTENYNATFTTVPSGYRLAVGLFVNQSDANPSYRLGIQGRTVNGWYILTGTVNQVASTWTNAAGGSWQTAGNWTGSSYTNGVDAKVDFSTLNLTGDATVTLNGNITAGILVFGDTTPSNNWMITSGTGGALTLMTSTGKGEPVITVNNQTTTISAPLFNSLGLAKNGSGTLALTGTSAMDGNIDINGGVLDATRGILYDAYPQYSSPIVTVNTGAVLQLAGNNAFGWGVNPGISCLDLGAASLVINGGTINFTGTAATGGGRDFSIGTLGATFQSSQSGGALTLSAGYTGIVMDNSSLTLAGNGAGGAVFQSNITGTGSLTKSGTGTWTLTGSNNYTGSTTVSAGKIVLSGSVASTASVSVASGATMSVTGKLYATGNITNSGTMIFSGTSPQFGAGGTITNNGTIINNSPNLTLPTIVNNGTILSVPPSPWVRADIGTVGITGSATYLTGTYTVMGGGAGITSSSDAFCYTYQTSSSDCSVVARVVSITNTNASAKGGVMIRDTTGATAMEAGVWVTPTSGIIFTYRKTTGGTTSTSSSTGKTAPYWVKITRTGNSFAGYYSTNGTTWTQLGSTQTISMGTSATIGLGVTSNVSATLCTSKLDNVTATP